MKRIAAILIISFFSIFTALAQHTVTGTITDENGVVPFVNIIEKGTTKGVIGDENGKYTINVASGEAVLQFSFIGYQSHEEKVNSRTVINVVLKAEAVTLDEMVVIAYGISESEPRASINFRRNRNKNKEKSGSGSHYAYQASPSVSYAPVYQQQAENEEYGSFTDNKFMSPLNEALSTFSIDVDAASYANMRRFINNGQMPPKDAIRTEELINYFNYNYPQPTAKHPLNTITEIGECPWNSDNRLVHIGIKAKEIPLNELPASHLIFLIDVSGSMSSYNKLPYVKQSFKMLVKQLRDIDKVSIITYSNSVQTLATAVSGKDKSTLNSAIDKLYASGGTAGGAAIQTAYSLAKDNFIKGGNNRVILASDGDFNIGLSSNEELEKLIEKERQGGVFLTVLGYGMGNYKDQRLQTLAQKGNGNHAYIDNITEAEKVLVTEFSGSMFTVAKDVKIQVEFNPAKVQAYRLIGYESRLLNKEDFNDDTKDAGEVGVGHTVTALYEIIPVGVKSNLLGNVDDLKYQKIVRKEDATILTDSPEMLTLKIRYKPADGDTSEKIEIPVLDKNTPVNKTSDNFRFSAAVAQVGMLLHNSPYKSKASYESAIELAQNAYGNDTDGNRHEFVKLVKSLSKLSDL